MSSSITIAIVEDNPFQLMEWVRELAALPQQPSVEKLASYEDAMMASHSHFDLWVVDYDLGSLHERSGFEVVSRVRMNHGFATDCVLMSHHPAELFAEGPQRELFQLFPKDEMPAVLHYAERSLRSRASNNAEEQLSHCRDLACSMAAKAFGWTPGEERTARQLMEVGSEEAARQREVSRSTIRRQWESGVAKSGMTAKRVRERLDYFALSQLGELRLKRRTSH